MNEEKHMQMAFVLLVKMKYPYLIFTMAPAGVTRGSKKNRIRTGVESKKMGYCKGWPDLFFAEPRHGYHGLFIEFKAKAGSKTTEQRSLFPRLEKRGYWGVVARSVDEAMKELTAYLKGVDLMGGEI